MAPADLTEPGGRDCWSGCIAFGSCRLVRSAHAKAQPGLWGAGARWVDRLIGTLRDAMSALATTPEELQQGVDQGQQLVAKLQADARTCEELARVNRTKAEAVATLVRGELATEGRRSFWKGFAMDHGFFVAGVVVSLVIAAVFGS